METRRIRKLRLFHDQISYQTALPYVGQHSRMLLSNGKWLEGRVVEVRRDGILFHSNNPGLFFYPFAAVALLALSVPFAFGLGYGLGASRPPYYYGGSPYYY